jgi:hypothetical protein
MLKDSSSIWRFVFGIKEKQQARHCSHCLRYFDNEQRAAAISKADIVISMLPAHTHRGGKDCIGIKKFHCSQ